jgi:hypothetical protein
MRTRDCGASPGSGTVRWMPVGVASKIQASTIAIGKPTSRNTTMKVTVHSGTRSAGSTTDALSVTPHATAPYAMATLPTRRRLNSAKKAIALPETPPVVETAR